MAVYAIGDIHGCLLQLEVLLDAINPTPQDTIVTLGDYIDRGPDSAGVLDRLLTLKQTRTLVPLLGNHEEMLLEARYNYEKYRNWLSNGGDAALASYAGIRATIKDIPPAHFHFMEHHCLPYYETESHFFVHANAYPDMPLDQQPDYMLRWERFEKVRPHDSGKIMVCGHTPQKNGRVKNLGFAVCIDTHAHGTGLLTCLETNSGKIIQADAGGRVMRMHLTDFY